VALTWHSLFHTVEGIAALATILLALGTIVLAAGTLLTSRRTRDLAKETTRLAGETNRLASLTEQEVAAVVRQAQAATDEVGVSRLALQTGIRPSLVDEIPTYVPPQRGEGTIGLGYMRGAVRFDTSQRDGSTDIEVPARNVGAGLAFIQAVRMHWDEPQAPVTPTTYMGTASDRVVPQGETVSANFSFGPAERPRIEWIESVGRYWVEIDYVDAGGGQAQTTRLDIALRDREGDETWKVIRCRSLTRVTRSLTSHPDKSTGREIAKPSR
jgi:hypothetical protein